MRPGAVLGLIDHVANSGGKPAQVAKNLHRVDPKLVKLVHGPPWREFVGVQKVFCYNSYKRTTGNMRRLLKWFGIGIGSLLGLALLAVIFVWIAGGWILSKTYDSPDTTFVANPAIADIDEGRRAALLRGCFGGCHGDGLEGSVFEDDLMIGRFVAPDLTRAFREMSDQELDNVIRHGIRRNGKSTTAMPSAMFHHLSDTDFNNIIAFIRSQEPSNGPELEVRPGIMARLFLLIGKFTLGAQQIRDEAPWLTNEDTPGRYLAVTVCSECHGMDLKGIEGFTPNLVITTAYSPENFKKLMREGISIGGRDLGLMSGVATGRFKNFTDAEIESLHSYLVTLVNDPPSQ